MNAQISEARQWKENEIHFEIDFFLIFVFTLYVVWKVRDRHVEYGNAMPKIVTRGMEMKIQDYFLFDEILSR